MVSEVVYREAFAWTFVMFELGEVRDGQPQVLAVVGGPVLIHCPYLDNVAKLIRRRRISLKRHNHLEPLGSIKPLVLPPRAKSL